MIQADEVREGRGLVMISVWATVGMVAQQVREAERQGARRYIPANELRLDSETPGALRVTRVCFDSIIETRK